MTGSGGCSITGSGATQALACTFASIAQGSSVTVAASAVTDTTVAKCSGVAMNNTAIAKGSNTLQVSDNGDITCQPPASPTLGTAPKIASINNDSATLAGLKGASPGGTLTFNLFQGANCAGTAIYTQVVPVTGNGTYSTTNAASLLVAVDTAFRWTVVYSGDSNNNGATSICTAESVVIDITP